MIIGVIVLALAAVAIFGFLRFAPWDRSMLAAVFLILVFGGLLLAVTAIVWLTQDSKVKSLLAETGEVIVAANCLSIGGKTSNWNYGELGRRYHDSRTMILFEGTPRQIQLLEVRTIADTLGTGVGPGPGSRDVITSHRAPIPAGKLYEAEQIVRHFHNLAETAKKRDGISGETRSQ